jgi:hypothetical protein
MHSTHQASPLQISLTDPITALTTDLPTLIHDNQNSIATLTEQHSSFSIASIDINMVTVFNMAGSQFLGAVLGSLFADFVCFSLFMLMIFILISPTKIKLNDEDVPPPL